MGVLSSTKPDAWTLSPQMTAAPELWRGCVLLFPFWENTGAPNAIGDKFLPATKTNTPEWILTEHGPGYRTVAGSQEGINTAEMPSIGASEPLSVFAYFTNRASQSGFQRVSEIPRAGGDALISYYGAENLLIWTREGGSNDNTGDVAANQVTFGDLVHNVYTHEGNGGTTFLYKDGVQIDTQSNQNAVDISRSSNLWLGRESDEGADSTSTDFLFYAMWNRVLTPEEAKFLARDPFAMLRPAGF